MFSTVSILASLTYQPVGSRGSTLQTFDLSNNRSLRSLEIDLAALTVVKQYYCDNLRLIMDLLSTITSPVFSEVVIILPDKVVRDPNLQNTLFPVVRGICETRPFCLIFRLGKLSWDAEYDRERLKETISVEAAKGGFGPLLDPPVFASYTRMGL